LVAKALEVARDRSGPLLIADVATGSGAVAVALARELKQARLVATDLSSEALAVARENLTRVGVADRVELRRGDLFAALQPGESFDLITANLPYVASSEIASLGAEIALEPRLALDGGADGLDLLRRFAAGVENWLEERGVALVEHGPEQGEAMRRFFAAASLRADTYADLAGRPRVTSAQR
jgi:release factor glutamine methyltransferase